MNLSKIFFSLLIIGGIAVSSYAGDLWKENLQSFFYKFDLKTDSLPTRWTEGYFTGNGELGAMVYLNPERTALRWHLGKCDIQDHRSHEGGKHGLPGYDTLHSWSWSCFHWTDPRLDLGALELFPVGKITGGSMRLNIWDAEITGEIQTTKGEIKFRSLTHTNKMVEIIEYWTSEGECNAKVEWHPFSADAPRDQVKWYFKKYGGPKPLPGYQSNPQPVFSNEGEIVRCTQKLLAGGDYATAFLDREIQPGHHVVYATTVNAVPNEGAAIRATEQINDFLCHDFDMLIKEHRSWWHNYYPQSLIKIPDERLMAFYWQQIYKLACATRADRALMDNTGPWYITNAWAYATWDMNVQLCYWPTYAGNRLSLSKSLQCYLEKTLDQHIAAVPKEWQNDAAGSPGISNQRKIGGEFAIKGCLPWALHNIWLQYRYSMDEEMLRNFLYPYLRRANCYYMHLMEKGDDGYYHLPKMFSPEYPDRAEDTTFDLALFRWGCKTLLWANEHLGLNDPMAEQWQDILDHLVPYFVGENGWMVGKDVPFEISHRHHQHLMPFYPLHMINWDQEENRELIEKTVRHWLSLPDQLEGFSYAGAASFFAMMRKPEEAIQWIYKLLDSRIHPNTMYTEWEESLNPTIETPISVTVPVHEMLLQSWGDKIRVFPAIPDSWKDVSFQELRTEGAFLISAKKEKGKVRFVKVKSLAGEPCVISPGFSGDFKIKGKKNVMLKKVSDSTYSVDLKKGEEVILYSHSEN